LSNTERDGDDTYTGPAAGTARRLHPRGDLARVGNPLVDRNVGYDPLKDFTLLSRAVGHPAVVKRKGLNTIEE
jgi:hypothetical protein